MPPLYIYFIGPIFLVCIGMLKIYGGRMNRKKFEAMKLIFQQEAGWSFEERGKVCPCETESSLFREFKGYDRFFRNIMTNTQDGVLEAVIFDFSAVWTMRITQPYGNRGRGPYIFIVAHFTSPTFRFPNKEEALPDGLFVEMKGNNFLCYRHGEHTPEEIWAFKSEAFQTLNRYFASSAG